MSARACTALSAAIAALAATGCTPFVPTCLFDQAVTCRCADSRAGYQICEEGGTSGCSCTPGGGGTPLQVKLIKPTCGSTVDPMAGVARLRLRLLLASRCLSDGAGDFRCEGGTDGCGTELDCGFGSMILEQTVSAEPLLVKVPAGPALLAIEVSGFPGEPQDGEELSFGRSAPFAPGASTVSVHFRRVGAFSPVCQTAAPTERTSLARARAGHAATLMDDGRMLFTGGFDTTGAASGSLKDPSAWTYLDSAEIFDPATGAIDSTVPAMNKLGVATPRAFHTATAVGRGQVLIAGGEHVVVDSGVRSPALQTSTLLFERTIDNTGGWAPHPARIARSRHAAITEMTGVVLLYGGLSFDGTGTNPPTYVQSYEWFDPALNLVTKLDPASQAPTVTAVGHAGAPLYGGKYLGVVGGSMLDTGNAGKLNKDRGTKFFMYREGRMQEQTYIPLPVPRTFVSIAGQGVRYLIAGGFQDFDPAHWWDLLPGSPYGGTDILNLKGPGSQPQILQGPSLDVPRGHTCSVTLPDGRMLVIGGRGGAGSLGSLAATTLFTDDGNVDPQAAFTLEKGPDLAEGRYFHTCTLLADGSVLVAGGVAENGSDFATLGSLEIFVPRPPAP